MAKSIYDHAVYELKKLGLVGDGEKSTEKVVRDTLGLISRFQKQKHDDFTAKWVIEFFGKLANMIPLSPITDDPSEWEEWQDEHKNIETGETETTTRWQSKRAPFIVSMDGGKTFLNLRTNKSDVSLDYKEQEAAIAKEKAERMAAKAVSDNKNSAKNVLAKPQSDTSTPAGEI